MDLTLPRFVLAAERGSAGKTTLALGLLAAWRRQGRQCAAFKKGPDYIDPAWLSLASGRPCRNLDTFLMGEETTARSFRERALPDGVNLIEGARGLFDGVDSQGTFSTAELAKLLRAPVVVALDCTKRTRTAAAVAVGCRLLDDKVPVAGFILNHLATARQERVVRGAVESATGLKVFGAVPNLADPAFHERHLGLTPPQEDSRASEAVDSAREVVEKYLDVEGLWRLAHEAPPLAFEACSPRFSGSETGCQPVPPTPPEGGTTNDKPVIGYFHDAAFHFYYPENLEALEALGARLVPVDAMRDKALPSPLHGLYIGGGFPEECAAALAANASMRASVKRAAEDGLPIYAECGGLMYLGRGILSRGASHDMAGVFPVTFQMDARPQGHGYIQAVSEAAHPFAPAGTRMKGHEFHYSHPIDWDESAVTFALRLERGSGFAKGRDGLVHRNTFATYVHVHALGEPWWAPAVVRRCAEYARFCSRPM